MKPFLIKTQIPEDTLTKKSCNLQKVNDDVPSLKETCMQKKKCVVLVLIIVVVVTNLCVFATNDQGHPAYPSEWAAYPIMSLMKLGFLSEDIFQDYQTPMTRQEFAEIAVTMLRYLQPEIIEYPVTPFTDTDDEWATVAKSLAIIKGYEDGSFRPNQNITREEMAHLFVRVFELAKISLNQPSQDFLFKDHDQIFSWSRPSVYLVLENKIMKGKGSHTFKPKGFVTKEEVLVMVYRSLFERPIDDDQVMTGTPVPIITYHHFADGGDKGTTISAERFEAHLQALEENGYESIHMSQLEDYVYRGGKLPEKPVIITIDDGYASNYEVAYPLLQKYNTKASIFIIGVSVGKEVYKNTDYKILPHFTYDEALEMIDSGLIEIQSHTYDMHQYGPYEPDTYRVGVLRNEGESEWDYHNHFKQDYQLAAQELTKRQIKSFAYSYPFGMSTYVNDFLLSVMGVNVTMSTDPGISRVLVGLPDTLFQLKRKNIDGDTDADQLLEMLKVE